MSIPASGQGGTIGGPATPTVYETTTTASTVVAQTNLGITADSLDRPLPQMDAHTLWKYNTNANNPFISPLNRLRIVLEYARKTDAVWTEAFARLVRLIAEETRAELLHEAHLPPEMRNHAYGALDQSLGWMAKIMTWLNQVSRPPTDEQIVLSRTPENTALSSVVMDATVTQGLEIVTGALNYLDQVGPQDPNFDGLTNATNNVGNAITNFTED